ncbi:DoxX family protein [Porphyromonadaceae sp. NP-X]|nr:DoxX family protein [Porphyromonadaceae sp. NP-X]
MKAEKIVQSFILTTVSDNRSLLPRLIVGLIFLSEGIQKFLFPELLGTGRFEKIGFIDPAFWAYFAGTFEIMWYFYSYWAVHENCSHTITNYHVDRFYYNQMAYPYR